MEDYTHDLTGAIQWIHDMLSIGWNALGNVSVPLLDVSFRTFILTMVFFAWACKLIAALTSSPVDKDKQGGKLDNNNHYIYRDRRIQ